MTFFKAVSFAFCLIGSFVAGSPRTNVKNGRVGEKRVNFGAPQANEGNANVPNVLFILFDDMGYSDFAARGAEYPTPNLDSFYEDSIVLNYHYIGLVCSPTRSMLLTGRFAWNYGLSLQKAFNTGTFGSMPTAIPTLGNLLQDYTDYHTYYAGKWHLGVAAEEHLPENRGWEEFHGFYTSGIDYATKILKTNKWGIDVYDWRANGEVDYDTMDTYSTIAIGDKIQTLVTDHMAINEENNENKPFFIFGGFQVTHTPLDFLGDYGYSCDTDDLAMVNEARQQFCENVLMTDDVFGDLMTFLKDNDQWDNTMIVVTSDNGGAGRDSQGSSNYPLRGSKGTFFEGGIRTVAFVGGGYVPENQRGTERNEFMHVVDWIPTLLSLGGADMDTISSDLQSILYEPMAESLSLSTYGTTSKKTEFLLDTSFDGYDLSQWLIYGNSKDNQRTDVPLSMNSYDGTSASFKYDFKNEKFDTDNNDISKIKSGKALKKWHTNDIGKSETFEDLPNGDIAIIFTSSTTGKLYKFMYLTDLPINIVKRTYCSYTNSMKFKIDLLNGESKINIEEDHSINRETDDLKMLCEDQKKKNYTSNKLLFDLNDDPTEEINLLEENSDDSMHVNINELISVYNEALDLVDDYLDTPFQNDVIYCIMDEYYDESNPTNFDSDSIAPWWTFDEYTDEFTSACDGEIDDAALLLYTTTWDDYKTNYQEKQDEQMKKKIHMFNMSESWLSFGGNKGLTSVVILCFGILILFGVYCSFGDKLANKIKENTLNTQCDEYTPLNR